MYRDRQAPTRALHPATVAVLAGRHPPPGGPLNQPPVFASAFRAGDAGGYARRSNPTWEALEEALGGLDGGNAVAFASGMAAVDAMLELQHPGARVVAGGSAYVEVRELLHRRRDLGLVEVIEADPLDDAAIVAAAARADLLWLDALTNPTLDVPALDRILPAVRAAGTTTVVDATLATPLLVRPLELGADLVVHSATKYVGGHSDLVLGAAIARHPRLAARLRDRRTRAGSVPGTMEAWLALRGLRTLPVRVERGAASAALLAERLSGHPAIASGRYPGLPGDRAHATATRMLGSYGAIVAFDVGDAATADAVCAAVRVIAHASSLGGVETLLDRPGRWHAGPDAAGGLLRLSVGCEDPEDLWLDLAAALDAAGARRPGPTRRTMQR